MTQQLTDALRQALSIVSGSPVIMFLLAAALIYFGFTVLGRAINSVK